MLDVYNKLKIANNLQRVRVIKKHSDVFAIFKRAGWWLGKRKAKGEGR